MPDTEPLQNEEPPQFDMRSTLVGNRKYHQYWYVAGITLTILGGLFSVFILLLFSSDLGSIQIPGTDETTKSSQRALTEDQIKSLNTAATRISLARQQKLADSRAVKRRLDEMVYASSILLGPDEQFISETPPDMVDAIIVNIIYILGATHPSRLRNPIQRAQEIAPDELALIEEFSRNLVALRQSLDTSLPMPDLFQTFINKIAEITSEAHIEQAHQLLTPDIAEANAKHEELTDQILADDAVITQLRAITETFGEKTVIDATARALSDAAIRIGSLGLTVFLIQILLSFTRYHLRMADHFRALIAAYDGANGDIKLMAEVAAVTTAGIDFGKIPQSALEKAIDALKDSASFRRV